MSDSEERRRQGLFLSPASVWVGGMVLTAVLTVVGWGLSSAINGLVFKIDEVIKTITQLQVQIATATVRQAGLENQIGEVSIRMESSILELKQRMTDLYKDQQDIRDNQALAFGKLRGLKEPRR